MANLKKPLALAAFSASVLASFATPSNLSAQDAPHQEIQNVEGNLIDDSVPFAKPYSPKQADQPDRLAENTIENSTSQPLFNSLPSTEGLNSTPEFSSEHFAVPTPAVPFLNNQRNTHPLPSVSSMPTVIVRPPVNPTRSLNDLTVDVEKILTQTGNDYALKLVIPESIKVIELTPVAESATQRNFKIRVDQTGDTSDSMSKQQSTPPKLQIPSQFLPAGFKRNTSPNPTHVPNENGFKKNPFYHSFCLDQNTALLENEVYSNVVQATAEAPTPAPELSVDLTTRKEPATLVVSEMYGPAELGLHANADFVIFVANQNAEPTKDVNVTLNVPNGLDVVLLDRAAKVDAEAGSLSWSFDELAPGEEHFIRYRVKSLSSGLQKQNVRIELENDQSLECDFDTQVIAEGEDSSAPFLPYENE